MENLPTINEGGLPSVSVTESGTAALMAREVAQVQASMSLAKRFPRDELTAFEKMKKALSRPGLASQARYMFPRGGAKVTGPSASLARALASTWGNVQSGLRLISIDDDSIHIAAYAIDLETNTQVIKEDKFEKKIQRKERGASKATWQKTDDERELRELINRRGAILERNAILQILPQDFIDSALQQAESTVRKVAKGELKQSREDTIRNLVLAFSGIGVSREMIEEWADKDVDAIDAQELEDLREMYLTIRDGAAQISDYFKTKRSRAEESVEQANEELASLKNKKAKNETESND